MDSVAYKIVLVLHLATAIVGFGGMAVTGYLGALAAARGAREGAAIGEAVGKGYTFSEWPVYAVPILGIILVLLSEDVFTFSQLWITLSFLLYILAIGLLHGLHLPTVRRINALLAEIAASPPSGAGAPPEAAELDRMGARAGAVGGALNLLTLAVLVLMVFKPGFP